MQYVIRPLGAWTLPITNKRTGAHIFRSSWSKTLQLLDRELGYLKAANVVFQIDVAEADLRLDGMLRANAKVNFPGVKIAFDSKHGPLTYATDAYQREYGHGLESWQANIRAIALGLESLRAVDRYGITQRGEQYVGWKALPPGTALGGSSHMTSEVAVDIIIRESEATNGEVGSADDPSVVRSLIRRAKANAHPDRNNGDRSRWDAVEAAESVLRRTGAAGE